MIERQLRPRRLLDVPVTGPLVLLAFAWFVISACGDNPGQFPSPPPRQFPPASGDEVGCDSFDRGRSELVSKQQGDNAELENARRSVQECEGRSPLSESEANAKYGCDKSRLDTLERWYRSKEMDSAQSAELISLRGACDKAWRATYACRADDRAFRRDWLAASEQRVDYDRKLLAAFDACVEQKRQARLQTTQPSGAGINPNIILQMPGLFGGGGRHTHTQGGGSSSSPCGPAGCPSSGSHKD